MKKRLIGYVDQPISIAPLITFRIVFGLLMTISSVRYLLMGWVKTQLIDPSFHFHYYGFSWVKPLPGIGLYFVFALLIIASVAIAIGAYYRFFATLFFVLFTYVELIDLTYYLNHYYFVSVVSFLMILVPAHRSFSIDVWRGAVSEVEKVPRWCLGIFKLQIAIVYCYAGLAKINVDWLVDALPLSIWLPAKSSLPFIGSLFSQKFTPYLFSWMGMLFDTFIIFGLLNKSTRLISYALVIVFHLMTGILFQIGIFPLVMIFSVLIFFSPEFHQNVQRVLGTIIPVKSKRSPNFAARKKVVYSDRLVHLFLFVFISFQLLFPWRYLLYPGNIFWTEEGYRFSWRVMLMEKAGTATFYVKDGQYGREGAVINAQFLNPHQEKQMAMQPDMILQFAHHLGKYYAEQGMEEPQVRAETSVTLNGRKSQMLIDPTINLMAVQDGWKAKDWILPYEHNQQ